MIATNEKTPGQFTTFVRRTAPGLLTSQAQGPEAQEQWQQAFTPNFSGLITDAKGAWRGIPAHSATSTFVSLPNATSIAAGKDLYYVYIGTGTVVIARSTKGGINVKTQASSPATGDSAIVVGVSGQLTASLPLRAAAQPALRTLVNLTQGTLQLFFAGLNQTITAVDPTASSGDGAGFLFDPTNATTTGLAAAVYQKNWIAFQKVAGVNSFFDTGIPVLVGADTALDVAYDSTLTPSWFINGDQVALNVPAAGIPAVTLGVAGTANATLGALVGVKIVDAGTPAQHDFDLRFLSSERWFG